MPMHRHDSDIRSYGGHLLGESEPERAYVTEGRNGTWSPLGYDPEVDPIRHGTEAFFQRSLPDGTPLGVEERKYLAAIVVNHLKQEGE